MSRSRRNKKKRGVTFSRVDSYNEIEQPESIDSPQFVPQGRALASSSAACRGMQPDTSGQYPKLPTREIPILGPSESDSEILSYVEESFARDLIQQGKLTLGPKITKHIQALRIVPPPPPKSDKAVSLRAKGVGDPTRSDSIDNPEGCFTFVSLGKEPARPSTYRALPKFITRAMFMRPVVECLEQ